ncbi:hypothetical protein [Methylobacterium sp. 391_Methyba4]|uniref:hypothetical protein n=1 Tax=Methylobacterium sp. 391_Methyba4 TaxID=3038924 RepID=UPI00241F5F5B|nr:hypothetical protein [Methylobacterium sp. 391_Methyba4]WFS06239.1 hypothetical protein P9K36_22980 [Methylobacterium sp. 391_Methyba4]
MTELRTDPAVLSALRRVTRRNPSPEQIEQQRLSFVMGVLPESNDMTREEVREVLDRQRGEVRGSDDRI